ncbi:MAG TPA: hypothetical protein VL137_00470 [Polyangiaceae bacterium]|nr:hypothetical protein [Polyangiaceae bacterium]
MSAPAGKYARILPLAGLLLAVAFATGCQNKIGDKCNTTADCTTGVDRICDTTQPGGYCTIFNCEPDTCPHESACVAFRTAPASAEACQNSQEAPRLERTFCMLHCNRDSDCRAGYACIAFPENDPQHNPWSAEVIDHVSAAVCMVPYSGPSPGSRDTAVCNAAPQAPELPNAGTDAALGSDASSGSADGG